MLKSLLVEGSYSPFFKTHPSWKVLEPVLGAYNIKENNDSRPLIDVEVSALISASNPVPDPDLELYFKKSTETHNARWDVVVVSPSGLKLSRRAATAAKLKAFINAHSHGNTIVAFLCREVPLDPESNDRSSLQGLMDLHQLLIPIILQSPPVLAIFDPMELLSAIQDFVQRSASATPQPSLLQHTCPFTLLSHHAEIADHVDSTRVLAKYHSMRELSQAIRTESGRDLMNAFFHHGETEKLARFMLQDSRVD